MKITTRISLGYGLFIAVLLILVVYQVFTIHRIQSINRTVSSIDFQNTLVCLQAMRDLDLVEEGEVEVPVVVAVDPIVLLDILTQLTIEQEY